MKLKKLTALMLAGLMTVGLAACGSDANTPASGSQTSGNTNTESNGGNTESGESGELSGELTVWTLADDLIKFGAYFEEKNPGVTVNVIKIDPGDYQTKLETALLGGDSSIDVIVGEPKHLKSFYAEELFANLDEFGAKDYDGKIVDYVWEMGQDDEGIQRAISYQITPMGIFYRRDIAEKVFGFSDPESVGELFKDYETIVQTGATLRDAGYKIFGSTGDVEHFKGDSTWVIDGKLNVDPARLAYMDLATQLYQENMTAFSNMWTTPWYASMKGPITMLTAETQWEVEWDPSQEALDRLAEATEGQETTEVFAFGLPSWGVLTLRDNCGDNSGKFGVCAGPAPGYDGGTYIGISDQSKNKDLAWEFIKFCTLNEETADWWIEDSEGDCVSLVSALEKHAEDENEVYGGQQLYKFFLEQAKGINLTAVTEYDTGIADAWGTAISAVQQGQMTKEEAIDAFYDQVANTYPDLIIER